MADHTSEGTHAGRDALARAALGWGVVVSAAVVAGLYAVSAAGGFVYGNLVFGATALAMVSWLAFAGWGRRTGAARKNSALLLDADRQYARELSRGTDARLSVPARVVFVLTGTTVLGWGTLLLVA